jgi:hypothetical protein
MRAQQLGRGPEPEHLAAAVQFGTVEPPVTAADLGHALDEQPVGEWVCETCGGATGRLPCPSCAPCEPEHQEVAAFPGPPAVAPVAPVMGKPPAAPAFSSERRGLDWRSRHDPRSLAYGVRGRLRGSAPLADRLWPSDWPTLDQGAEGACIGMAVAGWANTMHRGADWLDSVDAHQLYERAQELDEVPGEDYVGTSVLAGMQAGVEAGLFGGYLWAFGTKDVAQAVLQRGPVVVGVPWLSGMYDTGPGGLVKLEGDEVGGHALIVAGLRMKGPNGEPGPFFVWHNSWGDDYGDGGLGYVHHRDLALLLRGRGEAAIPTAEAVIP